MNCRACGAVIAENSVYCHMCGQRVDVADASTAGAEGTAAAGTPAAAGAPSSEGQAVGSLQDQLRRRNPADDVEQQLWQGRYSGKDMIGIWAMEIFLTALLLVAGFYFWKPTLWLVVLGIVVLMFGYTLLVYLYRRLSVRYRLTSQRFFHERGILRHVTDRIEVIDMDDITTVQSLLQRLANVGRLKVTSSDRTHPELILDGIENVHGVAQMMDGARRAERVRRGLHIEAI